MRAEEERGEILTSGSTAEDVSGGVHPHREACLAHELGEPSTRSEVGLRKADTGDAGLKSRTLRATKRGEFFERGPQSLPVHVTHERLGVDREAHAQQNRHENETASVHVGIRSNSMES